MTPRASLHGFLLLVHGSVLQLEVSGGADAAPASENLSLAEIDGARLQRIRKLALLVLALTAPEPAAGAFQVPGTVSGGADQPPSNAGPKMVYTASEYLADTVQAPDAEAAKRAWLAERAPQWGPGSAAKALSPVDVGSAGDKVKQMGVQDGVTRGPGYDGVRTEGGLPQGDITIGRTGITYGPGYEPVVEALERAFEEEAIVPVQEREEAAKRAWLAKNAPQWSAPADREAPIDVGVTRRQALLAAALAIAGVGAAIETVGEGPGQVGAAEALKTAAAAMDEVQQVLRGIADAGRAQRTLLKTQQTTRCCDTCESGKEKYHSIPTPKEPDAECGESCLKPSRYPLVKMVEPWLTPGSCSSRGYTQYKSTETEGVMLPRTDMFTVKNDRYVKPAEKYGEKDCP